MRIGSGVQSAHGQDSVEFYISTNPGEAPKPLAKIASGGELSRITLAIKNAMGYMTDFELMGLALEEAAKAAALGEVPVGAVVARHGEVIATAHNTRETEKNALHHAELLAIDAACKALGGWRLPASGPFRWRW